MGGQEEGKMVHCDGQGEVMKRRNGGVRGLKGLKKQNLKKELPQG